MGCVLRLPLDNLLTFAHDSLNSMEDRMKNQVLSQKGTGGSSMPQGTATGSGSRPTGSKVMIPSSNPSSQQKIRGKK